jgi:hypothetical protein
MILLAQFLGDPFWTIFEITSVSLRQSVAPPDLLGRVSACMHIVQAGLLPVGSLCGGLLAEAIGVREALTIAAVGGSFGAIWLLLSPVVRLRHLPGLSD